MTVAPPMPATAAGMNLLPPADLGRWRFGNKPAPKLALALSVEPAIAELTTMINTLQAEAKLIQQPTSGLGAIHDDVRTSLAAGEGLPDGLLERMFAVETESYAFVSLHRELSQHLGRLFEEREQLARDALPKMCQVLDRDLRRVIDDFTAVADAPASADDAIASKRVDEYRKASDARKEYAAIRAAQNVLLDLFVAADPDLGPTLRPKWPMIGHAACLGSVWIDLPEWDRYEKKQDLTTLRIVHLRQTPWPNPNSPEFLDWLVAHPEADPWVPTFDQAAELLTRIQQRAIPIYLEVRTEDHRGRSQIHGARPNKAKILADHAGRAEYFSHRPPVN